jgi:hypothetical protein
MPQKSKEATAYDKAREHLETLKKAMDDSAKVAEANGATKLQKDAAAHAKERHDKEATNVRRLGFKQIGGMRTTKAIIAIRALAKVANVRAYNFSSADIAKIESLLTAEMVKMRDKFNTALAGKPTQSADISVTFD